MWPYLAGTFSLKPSVSTDGKTVAMEDDEDRLIAAD